MHKILEKRQLSYDKERDQSVYYFKVEAPEIARNRKAGQFIIFQITEKTDKYQKFAAYNSSMFTKFLLENFL